ncbi:MAG: alpha/beta hydrolase fold domain-containing protein [Planctomycetota bacterium]|nr:alpha/beta hydrolase fold domain-containing protein [Planctomycetota bacterium]
MSRSPACLLVVLAALLPSCHTRTTQAHAPGPELLQQRDVLRTRALQSTNPLPSMESIEQRTVQTSSRPVTLQVYQPGGQDLPVVLLIPSIDFTAGDIVTHDHVARSLAAETPALVILPSLPLEPENTRREVINASFDVLSWTHGRVARWGGNPDCILLVGEGAGAALATKLAQRDRDGEKQLSGLVLLTPSFGEEGLPMAHSLRDLPATYVFLGEDDPLGHEGDALVDAMTSRDMRVSVRRQRGIGALRMDWALADPELLQIMLEVAATIRKACSPWE